MARRLVLVAVVALSAGSPAFAQPLDAEPKQSYLWRVVVKTNAHPLVTPEFRERVKRDVVAALQTGIGTLGAVEVFDLADPALPRDKWEPLWQQFDEKGFAALDAPRDLTGAKTHFLRVEYRDGKYFLETRQYDGFTGLSSPLVRAQSVRAPEQVGRAAGLMLDRDFGLVGTVEAVAGRTDEVKVLLRGSGLGPMSGLVRNGDVFAVAAVRKTNRPAPAPVRTATGVIVKPPPGSIPPPAFTSTPRDFTYLKVVDPAPDGTLRCTVLTRYQTALPPAGVIGYRCMKLGTVKAQVAVKLVSSDGVVYKTASTVTVRANDAAFPNPAAPEAKDVCAFDNKLAQFRGGRVLNNIACVTVGTSPTTAKQFPVPILSDDPITIPFDTDPAREERAAFERAVLSVASAAADARLAQTVCFDTVAKLIDGKKNTDALGHATLGAEAADNADATLTDELARLKEQGKTVTKAESVDVLLTKIKQSLDALKANNVKLKEHIKTIKAVVKIESDPAAAATALQAESLNARIRILLTGGDVDQALAAYDQLITIVPDDADVKKRRADLAAEWNPKDAAHQKARDYLLKTWPAVATIQDFKDSLPLLRAHVDTCKKHGDKWTARRLLTLFGAAGPKLIELTETLDRASETDRKLATDANTVGKVLAAMEVELRGFVGESP